MNGPEHWRKAENHLTSAHEWQEEGHGPMAEWHQRQALAHATLALTAATLSAGPNLIPGGWAEAFRGDPT